MSSLVNVPRSIFSYSTFNFRKAVDNDWAQMNLRLAVTPSSQTCTSERDPQAPAGQRSSLAGDPQSINSCERIQPEVLALWNQRPQLDLQKEWIRNTTHYY
ncbi:uncharacterized protein LOC142981449 [Anticarsia gemmatalis]|uniref:uncharacterized protein LOC142981449 n=1 Tax=Anticarsia gemmatalis TaxID=129554 RepID=UPI003F777CA5